MPISLNGLEGEGGGTPPERSAHLPTSYNNLQFRRQDSEDSIPTEFCDGPLPVNSRRTDGHRPFETTWTDRPLGMDRADHIRRLKQEQSSLWPQNIDQEGNLEVRKRIVPGMTRRNIVGTMGTSENPASRGVIPYDQVERDDPDSVLSNSQAGLEIERPRSALHSGDFTEQQSTKSGRGSTQSTRLNLDIGHDITSSPWASTSPPRQFTDIPHGHRDNPYSSSPYSTPHRSRAPSLSSSYSSSFALKPPTSPLVHSESNDELDFSTRDPIDIGYGFPSNPRRHTLNVSRSLQSTPALPTSANYSRPLPHLRRDASFPYQAHQPLRSFTSHHSFHHGSTPHTPGSIRRRPSISDSSPLQHASMVGSYEESILRGRMSTTPSKPLDFVAQIGVLGLGDCSASLRCPAHVVVPFPAVFYSYGTTSHSRSGKAEDGPSPYVGQIDLENGLSKPEHKETRQRHTYATDPKSIDDMDTNLTQNTSTSQQHPKTKKTHKSRRSGMSRSLRAPPGGSYRIPEKGQIQIIIKNPNKTAVKLFLIPYDLAGMEPGTKTFIRQRSYSAGPIIDMGTSIPTHPERPILRYLIHLHICSPSRGRFFLYKSIRVVFANRVPDGKEKLRNEVQHPEPRYSAYKPARENPATGSLAGANLAAEKAFRRRSSGFPLSSTSTGANKSFDADEKMDFGEMRSTTPVEPIPFDLFRRWDPSTEQDERDGATGSAKLDGKQDNGSGTTKSSSWNKEAYDKLNIGEAGYGAPFSNARYPEEGLLARRLRGLDVGNLTSEK